nr:hypothetical protein [Tanacetum cinerariifolium]
MALTFADTQNMIAYLTKSDASEGFNQIIDFLNGISIKFALTVNPNIYVSCIKQFWSSVLVMKVNDVMRFQALVNKKRVVITEATIRDALELDDAEGIDYLPNAEIFTELARMGYEKPSTKLTFYKEFFSSQWKFLIHTILQCMSAKRTSWNEFSSSMASAVICLSTCRKFNFSKYIFDRLVRNVDSSTKFYMYLQFLQLMIKGQVGDLSPHITKYSSPALTQKVFTNMRRVGKGCSGVDTPLFKGMLVAQQVDESAAKLNDDDVLAAGVADEGDAEVNVDVVPATKLERRNILKVLRLRRLKKVGIAQRVETSDDTVMDDVSKQERIIADMDADVDVTVKDVAVDVDAEESMQDDEVESTELQEVVEVVTTAKLITEVVTAASATITAAALQLTTAAASTLTTAPSAAKRRKGVKTKEQMEEVDSRAFKRISESQKDKAAKKQKLDEEVEELKKHLQIVPNDEDNAYTKATPLARKVPVVDYEIYTENNKPYYKIIRADGSPHLFLSFLSLLRNFDREDLEVLWELVKESSSMEESKNSSWFSKGQKLETVRVLWSSHYHIYLYTDDLDSREKISTYKVHSGSTA